MRWSRGLSLLFLTLLALCLSAGRASAQLPNPIPSPRETSKNEQQQCAPITTNTDNQKAPTPSGASAIYQIPGALTAPPSNRDGNQGGQESPSNRWLILFTGALVIVGFLQFYAMSQQACYMRRANELTNAQLEIASRNAKSAAISAEAARRALDANRPYLMVVNERIYNFDTATEKDAQMYIGFALENCGKSQAVISTIRARLFVAKTLIPSSLDLTIDAESFPKWGGDDMYSAVGWIDKLENILAPSQQSSPYAATLDTRRYSDVAPGTLRTELLADIKRHALLIVLHGIVSYSDIFQQEYATEFIGFLNMGATRGGLRFNLDFKERKSKDGEK